MRPWLLQLVRELDDQDAVFRDQSDQRHQADLRIDVERRRPAIGEEGSSANGIFRNMKMSAPNMASGTEPSRMMSGSRKLLNCAARTRKIRTTASPKARQKFVALDPELARLAGVIDRVTLRQNLVRFVLEKLERLVDRADRQRR